MGGHRVSQVARWAAVSMKDAQRAPLARYASMPPNLRLRPPTPAKGRGRIQRQIGRAFAVHGPEVTTGQVFDWCLARHRHDCWRRRERWSVVRVLMQVADRVGREATFPWGWLWRLKSSAADNVAATREAQR